MCVSARVLHRPHLPASSDACHSPIFTTDSNSSVITEHTLFYDLHCESIHQYFTLPRHQMIKSVPQTPFLAWCSQVLFLKWCDNADVINGTKNCNYTSHRCYNLGIVFNTPNKIYIYCYAKHNQRQLKDCYTKWGERQKQTWNSLKRKKKASVWSWASFRVLHRDRHAWLNGCWCFCCCFLSLVEMERNYFHFYFLLTQLCLQHKTEGRGPHQIGTDFYPKPLFM